MRHYFGILIVAIFLAGGDAWPVRAEGVVDISDEEIREISAEVRRHRILSQEAFESRKPKKSRPFRISVHVELGGESWNLTVWACRSVR